jgi:pimeloyl-ACP methyl ester carboxylesterase
LSRVAARDGTGLYCESNGGGSAVVFVHEFGGSCRSFDPQVAAFQSSHRCVTFNARGYPPSDVPPSVDSYSQDIAAEDIIGVLDGLEIGRAHLVGVSMGAASSLQTAIKHPARVLSATLASIGTGSDAKPEESQAQMENMARLIESQGLAKLAASMGNSPSRRKLKEKDPAEFRKFAEELMALSPLGMANTMRGVQKRRAPIYAHESELAAVSMPVLVVLGGDDAGCRGPSEFLARKLPRARLEVFPDTGHLINIEDAQRFNRLLLGFVDGVDAERGRG